MRRIAALATVVAAALAAVLLLLGVVVPSGSLFGTTTETVASAPATLGVDKRNQQDVPPQEEFCEDVWAKETPRYLAYDVVNNPQDRKFGPEISGDSPEAVLAELTRHVCLDPALLADLVRHQNFGYEAMVDPADRREAVDEFWSSKRIIWSNQAREFIETIRAGSPVLLETGDDLKSWYYVPGANRNEVPALEKGDLRSPRSVLLSYIDKFGRLLKLSLKCGGQPSDFALP